MYLRKSSLVFPGYLEKLNDNEGTLHGPILTTHDQSRFRKIMSGHSMTDIEYSWSRSDSIHVAAVTDNTIDIDVTISNYGDMDSIGATILIVVWGGGINQVAYQRIPVAKLIPSNSPTTPNSKGTHIEHVNLILISLLYGEHATTIATTSEISHVFAIIYDPPLDPPDKECTKFYVETKKGKKYFGPSGFHPCRLSRKISCLTINSAPAFTLSGTTITHTCNAYFEFLMQGFGTNSSAEFACETVGRSRQLVHGNLRSININSLVFYPELITEGVLYYYIIQSGTAMRHDHPRHGKITIVSGGSDIILINWNDIGDDEDFQDYMMAIIHR